jgi:hypothetical protein
MPFQVQISLNCLQDLLIAKPVAIVLLYQGTKNAVGNYFPVSMQKKNVRGTCQ